LAGALGEGRNQWKKRALGTARSGARGGARQKPRGGGAPNGAGRGDAETRRRRHLLRAGDGSS
jgi:hypothetical protein